jgi:rhodanese-related sulfurtransferase
MLSFQIARRLLVFTALAFVVALPGLSADEGSPSREPSRVGGKAQRRAILHTTDSLESVLELVREKRAVLLDVRELREWEQGHLERAVFLPLSKLNADASQDPEVQEKLDKISKDKIIYCHCKSGGRVLKAAPFLKSLGFDARALKAGYEDLLEAGFEKAEPENEEETDN